MTQLTKIRATMQDEMADIKILVIHPMETGQRKDPKTGELVPAHFIKNVTVTVGSKTVLEAQWSQAVSKNPYLGIRVRGVRAGDKVTVRWDDNKGGGETAETTLA